MLANARLSDRSARRYARLPALTAGGGAVVWSAVIAVVWSVQSP